LEGSLGFEILNFGLEIQESSDFEISNFPIPLSPLTSIRSNILQDDTMHLVASVTSLQPVGFFPGEDCSHLQTKLAALFVSPLPLYVAT
jgi:hypothetical protein